MAVEVKDVKLKAIMQGKEPDPNYKGVETPDDIVFAINSAPGTNTKVAEYVVGEIAATSIESAVNPQTAQSTYIRAGQSTTKTGTQRTITYNADRFVGDPFQEYCLSTKFKTGQDVITDYVKFNIKTGKGEKGKVSVIVENDGSGAAGENSTVVIRFESIGEMPTEYTWSDDSSGRSSSKQEESEEVLEIAEIEEEVRL